MAYEVSQHRYPYNSVDPAYTYPEYCMPQQIESMSMAQYPRADARGYPSGGSVNTALLRGRGPYRREDTTESGSARKRISLACARCRKRKIRCSGDPGNGTGCSNCRQAGVDSSQCQFHRVGSGEFPQMLASGMTQMVGGGHGLGSAAMIPIYNVGGSYMFTRGLATNEYTQADTRSVHPQWNGAYSESSSPVESYGLDQASALTPNSMPMASMYGDTYRWNSARAFQAGPGNYTHSDTGLSMYTTNGMPYTSTTTSIRGTTANIPPSPLNMAHLQETLPTNLPERAPSLSSGGPTQQIRLPVPQPSPSQKSRNNIDQLQDRLLRSAQAPNGALIVNGSYTSKTPTAWKIEAAPASDTSSITSSIGASSSEAITQTTTSESLGPSSVNPVVHALNFLPATSMEGSASLAALPQLGFSTSSILDTMPPPTQAYSNFRDYKIPTSTASQPLALLARQSSQPNLYSYSSENSVKRHSVGTSSEATLINGQRYSPLAQQTTQNASDGGAIPQVPIHRTSLSTRTNRTF